MPYDINALFAPKDDSMSREQIWRFFFDPVVDELSEKPFFLCLVDKKDYTIPAYGAEEISDLLCREFVEGEYIIDQTYSEPIEYSQELTKFVKVMHKKIYKDVKKERVANIRAQKKQAKIKAKAEKIAAKRSNKKLTKVK